MVSLFILSFKNLKTFYYQFRVEIKFIFIFIEQFCQNVQVNVNNVYNLVNNVINKYLKTFHEFSLLI